MRELKDYSSSEGHYIFSNHPEELAEMIYEWQSGGEPVERDFYVLRDTLKYIAVENIRDSKKFYNKIIEILKSNNLDVDTPILNLCNYFIECVLRDALPLFQLLREKYDRILKIDQEFDGLLDRIAHVYYKQPLKGGLLSNFLQNFMS